MAADHLVEDLGDAEKSDYRGNERYAGTEFVHTEGEASVAGDRIAADGTEQQPEDACEEALRDSSTRDADHHRHSEDHESEHFRRPELEGDTCDGLRGEDEDADADHGPHRRDQR